MQYRFLIYISYSYAIPIGQPLEKEIKERDFVVKWFADMDEGRIGISHKNNILTTAKSVIDYSPHIILATSDSVPDFFKGLKVQVFHGFNAEKRPDQKDGFSHFRIRGFFDLYCTQGPTTTRNFKAQAKKHPHFEVIETGWPKVDPLFPLPETEPAIIPHIMIASTFTERLSLAFSDTIFKEIERLSNTGNFVFSMVLHPKVPQHIKAKWRSLNNAHFTYYDTTDMIPLFKKANIMFADTTSAIQEFLLQKKPVVTYNHTINHDYLINIKDEDQIESAFHKALSYPEHLIQNIDAYVKELHPYSDGLSSKRVIDSTITFLHQDKSHLRPKPLNLVRKIKMRNRLGYFTLKSYNKPYTISHESNA